MTAGGASAEIERAIAGGSSEQSDRVVDKMLGQMRHTRDASDAVAAGNLLRDARRFDALLKLADSAARTAPTEQAWELWPMAVTGLIELDATLTAERLVKSLLSDPASASQRGRLLARLGRIKKDQFVDSGDPVALDESIHAYVEAYSAGADPLWAGVNAVALRALASRRGLPADTAADISADDLFAMVVTAPMPRDSWSLATEVELRIARGESTEALQPVLTQLFDGPDVTGFVLASLARQLNEIWDLDPAASLMVMLGEHILASGLGEVLLPLTPDGYEKTFGAESPIPIDCYARGLHRARSVGCLLDDTGAPQGTVFAIRGADLHPALDGRIALVTNEHVVRDPSLPLRGNDGVLASEVKAHFTSVAGSDGEALSFGGLRAIWHSAREAHDITVLLSDEPGIQQLEGLELAEKLPSPDPGAYVYVTGHPSGGALQLSIRGNDFIAHDDIRLHYKAPTARGSSGSPVFDKAWKLIGVHHYGSDRLAALNGESGTYPANEGISILAIREAIHESPGSVTNL